MTDQSRRALHAYLSADSHDQWHAFAADFGVSVSAVLEVLGKHLGTSDHPPHALVSDARIDDFVADARRLDAARRRRTRA